MNYRELQQTLKNLRNAGHVAPSFKLNQKKEILQAEFDRIKAIALSKTITTSAAPTPQPQPQPETTEPALVEKPVTNEPANFSKLVKQFDNYIPAYAIAEKLKMNPQQFWQWAYAQFRQGEIELSTLQEKFRYTSDQQRYADPSGYFFVSFN